MDNKEIIGLYLSRNQRAIEETDLQYKKYLLKIAMNILGNREDAEEVLNDTYSAAWNSITSKGPNDLQHYLARIIKNKALHYAEKKNAGKRGGGQVDAVLEELEPIASEADNPEDSLIKEFDTRLIEEFLETLSSLDRKIFIRRYWFFEKIKDIADRHDVSSMTVKIRLRSCKKKLKQYLLKRGY